jgi:DNA-binding NarL/FixJ family response regulator
MPSSAVTKEKAGSVRSVFILDDQPICRHGMSHLINSEGDLTVCGEAGNEAQALTGLRAVQADMLIVDLASLGTGGGTVLKKFRAEFPTLPILVLSTRDEALYALRTLQAGAQGYLIKSEGLSRFLDAVRNVLAGQIYVSPTCSEQLISKMARSTGGEAASPLQQLTDRELEVLELLGSGNSTRQIAEKLKLSTKTIESHRAHLKEKLKLRTAAELLHYAVDWVRQQNL